ILVACLFCLSFNSARAQQMTGTYTTYVGGKDVIVDHYIVTTGSDGTLIHRSQSVALQNFTVKDETIDDALAAVTLLRATPGIEPKKIFVPGHSLGGALVPRIGLADQGSVAGFIVFAGATRPLEDEWVRQY